MEPIIGMKSGTAYLPETIADRKESVEVLGAEAKKKESAIQPVIDEYIPEGSLEPTGLYWKGKDQKGKPKIYFDDPERKVSSDKAENTTGNTDQVDREIEKLKQEQEELERQLNSETDEKKRKELQKKLTQVENELARKDNDSYRRQHTIFS